MSIATIHASECVWNPPENMLVLKASTKLVQRSNYKHGYDLFVEQNFQNFMGHFS